MVNEFLVAFRALRRAPGFAVASVLILTLGIALSVSSFSVTNALLFRTMPYPESQQLIRIHRTSQYSDVLSHAPGNYLDIRAAARSMSHVVGYHLASWAYGRTGQRAEQVSGVYASSGFLSALGLQPALGRDFTEEEELPGRGNVVMVSDTFWRRRLGGSLDAIGTTLRLDGELVTVVGILPKQFDAPLVWGQAELIRPLTIWPSLKEERSNAWFSVFGRLKPEVPVAQAQSEMNLIGLQLSRSFPKDLTGCGLRVMGLASSNVGSVVVSIAWMITALSVLVVVIACTNLASLQTARALALRREYAIRSALGASRWKMMKPFMVQSAIISAVAGVLGVVVAYWLNSAISHGLPRLGHDVYSLPIDSRVLLFASITSMVAGMVAGIFPAFQAAKISPLHGLKEGAATMSAGGSVGRVKSLLVVAQLALAIIVIGVTFSFSVATKKFSQRSVGWRPGGTFSGIVSLPGNIYATNEARRMFAQSLLEHVSQIPGVELAGVGSESPLLGYSRIENFTPEHSDRSESKAGPPAFVVSTSSGFFGAIGIELIEGTLFSDGKGEMGRPVVVVNKALASFAWPGRSAIGQRIKFGEKGEWLEVVAVVGNVKSAANIGQPVTLYQAYRPFEQLPVGAFSLVLRSSGDPEMLRKAVDGAIGAVNPDVPLQYAGATKRLADDLLANLNVIVDLLGAFALMSLLISTVGVYALISHLTAMRTREIGIRIAIGAQQADVIRLILHQSVRLLFAGSILGLLAATGVGVVLTKALPEMSLPGIPLQLLATGALCSVAAAACLLPARRAARVDPLRALRSD